MSKKDSKIYAENKKAGFDYEILDKLEAGLVLTGQEVKSIRAGQINLKGGYVTFHNGSAYLTNAHIAKYKYASNIDGYDPEQSRKLLLKKKEILYLQGKSEEKGLTIVPLSVYPSGSRVKVQIGVGKGKKKYDKRRTIKERELRKEVGKAVKDVL